MASVKKTWHGPKATRVVHGAAVKGLTLGAEHLLGVSKAIVPIDDGTLEHSGVASVDAGQLKAAVSYDTVYAVRQHEELDWEHDEGRQAKYLEEPMHAETETILAIIAAEERKAIGR